VHAATISVPASTLPRTPDRRATPP
jgi:hypothetical protein